MSTPLGLGVDLVDVERFRRVLARSPGIVERVFTEHEIGYAHAKRDPVERLAVRFAAKEATMKALGVGLGQVRFRDIEVVRDAAGAPGLELHGGAARRAEAGGVSGWLLSMSHTPQGAIAAVIAVGAR